MAFMEWSEKYVLNLEEVDQQHEMLFGIVNKLYDSVVGGEEQNTLGVILNELIDYTVNHFATEEKMFKEHNYPNYDEHKKEHDDLTQQVLNL